MLDRLCQALGLCGQLFILELYIRIQIQIIHLLIFTEKFSPLPVFEPGTSPVPRQYAANSAILAWIV